jgi:hypothetical protein
MADYMVEFNVRSKNVTVTYSFFSLTNTKTLRGPKRTFLTVQSDSSCIKAGKKDSNINGIIQCCRIASY